MLLNLAEEPEIEKKMAKRGIVGYLCKMLARSNTELLVLALIFLKKLAIFKENLPEMRREKLVAALVGFVPHHTEAVLVSALRLLYNLSFDAHQRDAIIASPLLTKAVGLVRKRMQLPIVLRLAYNLSSTEKGRKALGATDLPAIVRKHVLACAELELPAERRARDQPRVTRRAPRRPTAARSTSWWTTAADAGRDADEAAAQPVRPRRVRPPDAPARGRALRAHAAGRHARAAVEPSAASARSPSTSSPTSPSSWPATSCSTLRSATWCPASPTTTSSSR